MWSDIPLKELKEKDVEEMTYSSKLKWRYMKKLGSETHARHWHVKVEGTELDKDDNPIMEDYNILQVFIPRAGEKLFAYHAKNSGRPLSLDNSNCIFEKNGVNHLEGIEYLLRICNGEDISELDLRK